MKLSRSIPKAAAPQCSSLSRQSYNKGRFTVTNLSPFLSVRYVALVLCLSPSRLLDKSSEDGGDKLRPLKVVSFTDVWSIKQDSPEIGTSDPRPVSKPDITQAYLSHNPSLEGWRRECYKPPNWAVVSLRCLSSIVSTPVVQSAMLRSPESRTGLLLIKPDQGWAASATRHPGLELV